MKFFHLADLHFGKAVHDVQMTYFDQPFWVEQLLKAVDERQPDAIVIAGDVYDTRNPSIEAIRLLDHLVTELAARDKYVFIIPGNHDSNVRLSFGNELLKANRIYIAGELEREIQTVPLEIGGVKANFWLLPYIYPSLVESVLNRQDLNTYDAAMRALLAEQQVNEKEINILVAHQNVLANGQRPEHSESEAMIGGVGEIDYSAFEDFDYVALGHIHNAQSMGRDTVVYAGCPLFYDFSECDRWKGITEVTVDGKGAVKVERFAIPLLHKMLRLSGSVKSITEQAKQITNLKDYYVQAVITEHGFSSEDYNAMKFVLGKSLMNTDFKVNAGVPAGQDGVTVINLEGAAKLGIEENLEEFLVYVKAEPLDEEQKALVRFIVEQQSTSRVELKTRDMAPADEVDALYAFVMGDK